MTRLRDVLISAYYRGLRDNEVEAHRLVAIAIIDEALRVESMGPAPIDVLRRARLALAAAPLSEEAAAAYSDQLHAYLVEKNGQAVVQKDREDKAIRAAFEAFHSSVEYSGVEGMAVGTEALLTGEAGDILSG